jgi:hypothetical protein
MNSEDQNAKQPTSSEPDPGIVDLTLEEAPDAPGENIRGGAATKEAPKLIVK